MRVIADLCIVPVGVGVSLSPYIAKAVDILEASNLDCSLHAYGTNVEGEYREVFETLESCLEAIHGMGAPRVTCTIKLGSRNDRQQSMQDKVDSVRAKRGA